MTLDFIEQMHNAGYLSLGDRAFSEPVAVSVTEITHEATVYVAPVGTEPPASINDEFPDGWKPLIADE